VEEKNIPSKTLLFTCQRPPANILFRKTEFAVKKGDFWQTLPPATESWSTYQDEPLSVLRLAK
jgi:hypothetical protein